MTAKLTTGTIQTWAIPVLEEKLAKLNTRAAKCKCPPLSFSILRRYKKVVGQNAIGDDIVRELADVVINGDAPRINGWELVAKLTPMEGGNLVQSAEGIEIDPKYRTIGMKCDHCGTNRRRNDVFVIRKGDEERVIGRNCLADFLRTNNLDSLIYWADAVQDFLGALEDCESAGRREVATPIVAWLRTSSVCVRKLGWLGKGTAAEQGREGSATADIVTYLEWTPHNDSKVEYCRKNDLHVTDYDRELVDKALEWIRASEDEGDYMYNLRLACRAEYVTAKTSGLATSLIIAYQKALEKEAKREEYRAKAGERVWLGNIKERLRGLEVKVLGLRSYDSDWGVTTLVRFADKDENSIIWWASGDRSEEFEVGGTYKVDATVKKHDDHDTYGKQTVVNRVTVK